MQWILVLITDALAGKDEPTMSNRIPDADHVDHGERISLFTRAAEKDPELPYGPLLRCATVPMF